MTKTSISLQDLRKKIYLKAKADKPWRFWGLYTHVCKMETLIWAYNDAKYHKGAAGIDGVTFKDIEKAGLASFLEQIQSELVSETYRPKRNRKVEIPKGADQVRVLGIPTVVDRIAQMVAKMYFEPKVEPYFCPDSYGYRPGKSAIDAVAVTRQRCWRYNWLLEFDIKGLFDNIDHDLLMRAVKTHTDCRWLLLYIERWLKAPFQMEDGQIIERRSGTPQGGVISPVLSNLFLHYVFDKWMERNFAQNPWARYADDAVTHCRIGWEGSLVVNHACSRIGRWGFCRRLDDGSPVS